VVISIGMIINKQQKSKKELNMKTLIMVRHAKSSWANFGEPDFDRSLNERGKADAPEMAKRLKKHSIKVGSFISSPAKRARMTCKAFCEVFSYEKDDIIYIDKLYHAAAPTFFEVIKEMPTDEDVVAIFSHNPGITDFVNQLCKDVFIDNMPTCAVFAVQADVDSWNDFEKAERKFLFLDYPKLA
jgi:phosphohistidine phosphatase